MKQKQTFNIITGFIIILFMITIVSANQKICLTKGQSVPSSSNPMYTCKHDSCYVCVNNNNFPVYDKNCPGEPICGNINQTYDLLPPVLTISSPVNEHIYSGSAVLFSLTTDELATIYYKDNSGSGNQWKKIATKITSFNSLVKLKDGLNDLTIKAVDLKGNEAFINKTFRVDSQKPKILKINPAKGFATSYFEIWFTETNPKTLVLNYGNDLTGRKNANVNLNQCTGDAIKGKYYCNISTTLNEYNGQNIDYSFRLTDIADSFVDSKTGLLNVDTAKPVFNNIGSIMTITKNKVDFNLSINEPNLLSVSYFDNSDSKAKWTKLCSSLKNGICEKKVTFAKGNHNVDLKVDDKSGNWATTSVEFNII